ncbi:MAG: hypothetical protein ABIS18_01575 [Actinomycetota bacterium]
MGRLTGDTAPGAGDLSRTYAPTPLDSFGDLGLIDGSFFGWRTPLLLAARIFLVAVVLALLLRAQLTRKTFVRLGIVYLAALVSVAIPLGLSLAYLKLFAQADSAFRSLGVFMTLVLLPVVLTGLVVVWAPIAAQAVVGLPFKFIIRRRKLWLLSAASGWFYVFTSNRIEALEKAAPNTLTPFMLALAVITVQSVIFTAIAFEATRE